jgi:hypothetical protein
VTAYLIKTEAKINPANYQKHIRDEKSVISSFLLANSDIFNMELDSAAATKIINPHPT